MPIHSANQSLVNISNYTRPDTQQTLRDSICQRIHCAENMTLSDRIEEYESILNIDQLESLLTKEEIGNIFWNKALDHSYLADEYYNGRINGRQQLVPALRHQQSAVADMTTAKSLYENTNFSEMAKSEIQNMMHSLELIMEKLKENSAVIPG